MSKIIYFPDGTATPTETAIETQETISTHVEGWLISLRVDCLTQDGTQDGDCKKGYRLFLPLYLVRITTAEGETIEAIAYWDDDAQAEYYLPIDAGLAHTAYRYFNYDRHRAIAADTQEMIVPLAEYLDKVLYANSPIKTMAIIQNTRGRWEGIFGGMQGKEMIEFVQEKEGEEGEDE